jgi:hypothetical protein
MKTYCWLIGLPFLMGMAVGVSIAPTQAESTWVLNHCDESDSFGTDWRRSDARAYASSANGDGYDWGGGCWNGDGVDNTPNQDSDHNTEGEGPDCSGFVHKAWALSNTFGDARRYWPPLTNKDPGAHGPYTAADFQAGVGASNQLANKNYGTTGLMDAFASSSHIGMIYSEGSGGSDTIIEAKDQQTNTGIFTRNYRSLGSFTGVKRSVWDQ